MSVAPQSTTAPRPAEAMERFERATMALLRSVAGRDTLVVLAQRCGHDLPPVSWALLEHLDATGPMRVSDIAACHGVDISSVTPRLQRLEGTGLVKRGTDPLDARVSIISLSAAGRTAVGRIRRARIELIWSALDGIDPDAVTAAADLMIEVAGEIADPEEAR